MPNRAILAVILIFLSCEISWAEEDFIIRIKLSEFRLDLYQQNQIIASFDAATPQITPKNLPVEALVAGVEKNPGWHPTEGTREAYRNKKGIDLPEFLPPGDARNAMGKGLIRLNFIVPGSMDSNVVIHGTNEEKMIGKKISRGCIRLRNNDIETLIDWIKGRTVRVIFEN
jgi:lipoprotein-anchoring transpeptidase ErfK/SrfK